ncbi:MAG TPA: ABC transporter permease [Candidatus Methylomirabilis sp.]|nr:ABC transporter permease [Candidatus Methylomirabilis sp.]
MGPRRGGWLGGLAIVYGAVITLFTIAPFIVVFLASVTSAEYLQFPPRGLSLRWYAAVWHRPEVLAALGNSLVAAVATVILTTVLNVPAAYALSRYRFRGRQFLLAFLMSPLMLPGIVIGFAIVRFYGAIGFPLSLAGLVLAHAVVTLPYGLRTIAASMFGFDRTLEEAAVTLGAHPVRAFLSVTLPIIKPGLIAGAVFVFITSFDNVTVSLFLVSPRFTVLPMWLFSYVEQSADPIAAAIASAITVASLIVVVLLDRFVGLRGRMYVG